MIFEKAAAKGNVEVMELLFEKACPPYRAMHGAARHGCLTIMKWLKRKGFPIDDSYIMISAVEYGSLRNMKWLFENGCRPIDNWRIFGKAAEQGSLDIMKWLLDIGCSITHGPYNGSYYIMAGATRYGSLVNMKWLEKNGCPITDDPHIFYCAVCHGSLRNLKWFLENKYPVGERERRFAIQMFGSFEKLLQLTEVDPSIVIYGY